VFIFLSFNYNSHDLQHPSVRYQKTSVIHSFLIIFKTTFINRWFSSQEIYIVLFTVYQDIYIGFPSLNMWYQQKNTTGKGLYLATHCEGGASDFAKYFTVKDSICAIKRYQVVFQCRVQPEKFTEHKSSVRVVLT